MLTVRAIVVLVLWWLQAPPGLPVDSVVRFARDSLEAVEAVVWMRDESHFGRLRHSDYAPCDWGLLAIHGRPDLEPASADVESVRVWIGIKRANERVCHDDGLHGLSSGRCDGAASLVRARRQEAVWLDAWATVVAWRVGH